MMKTNIPIILLISTLALCSCTERKYKYVEKIKNSEQNTYSYTQREFTSKNDSTAYIEAYTKFVASTKVSDFSKKKIKSKYKTPVSFTLFNKDEVDISNYDFKTKKESEAGIRKKFNVVLNQNYASLIDFKKQEELKELYSVIKIDQQSFFYMPKIATRKDDSLFVVYMKQKDDYIDSLRVKFTYKNDVLTFAKKITFTTENSSFTIPLRNSVSSLSQHIEGFDEDITLQKDLIDALMKSKTISITLAGYQQEITQNVSSYQLEESKKMISQYLSLL